MPQFISISFVNIVIVFSYSVKFMCENDSMHIGCPPGNAIEIAKVYYGREDNRLCREEDDKNTPKFNPESSCRSGRAAHSQLASA